MPEISDELFSGWAVRILSDPQMFWVKVETSYGYQGYIPASHLSIRSAEYLKNRETDPNIRMITRPALDVLLEPRVQGCPLETLWKASLVHVIPETVPLPAGWVKIRTASGKEGFVPEKSLGFRPDTDAYFFRDDKDSFFHERKAQVCCLHSEEELRQSVADTAMTYFGAQYRWGGKSSQGLDCSGLAFMSYFLNGIVIYRDAAIRPGFPVHKITADKAKTADLFFFPGHVAVCIGKNRFIHATAFAKTPYVTINSLDPSDSLYRPDLAHSIQTAGSIF